MPCDLYFRAVLGLRLPYSNIGSSISKEHCVVHDAKVVFPPFVECDLLRVFDRLSTGRDGPYDSPKSCIYGGFRLQAARDSCPKKSMEEFFIPSSSRSTVLIVTSTGGVGCECVIIRDLKTSRREKFLTVSSKRSSVVSTFP